MVVLKHLNCDDMCKLKCGKFKCGEQETPTQWMKDMKRLCLLHEVTDKKVFSHWIDHAFQFKYEKVQATTIPKAVKHEVTIRQKSPVSPVCPSLPGFPEDSIPSLTFVGACALPG